MNTYVRPLSILVVLLSFILLPGCENAADPEVRESFEQLRTLMDVRDGEKAVAMLAPQSITQAEQTLRFARAASRDQVATLDAAERAEVLTMRNRLSESELKSLDGKGYLVLAVSKGWYARTSDSGDIALGRIRFQRDTASAQIILNGRETNATFNFDFIEGVWKLDWIGFDQLFNEYVATAAAEYGMSEDDILMAREERISGRTVYPSIWDR
jgi:hypothetical protein